MAAESMLQKQILQSLRRPPVTVYAKQDKVIQLLKKSGYQISGTEVTLRDHTKVNELKWSVRQGMNQATIEELEAAGFVLHGPDRKLVHSSQVPAD